MYGGGVVRIRIKVSDDESSSSRSSSSSSDDIVPRLFIVIPLMEVPLLGYCYLP